MPDHTHTHTHTHIPFHSGLELGRNDLPLSFLRLCVCGEAHGQNMIRMLKHDLTARSSPYASAACPGGSVSSDAFRPTRKEQTSSCRVMPTDPSPLGPFAVFPWKPSSLFGDKPFSPASSWCFRAVPSSLLSYPLQRLLPFQHSDTGYGSRPQVVPKNTCLSTTKTLRMRPYIQPHTPQARSGLNHLNRHQYGHGGF